MRREVEAWAAAQDSPLSLSEALRLLIADALKRRKQKK
jgi:hypothetical protein